MKFKIKNECQDCRTINYFVPGDELVCQDCAKLQSIVDPVTMDKVYPKCIFCNSTEFYKEYTLGLPFLAPKYICYLCEAQYSEPLVKLSPKRFDHNRFNQVMKSDCAKNWAKFWNVEIKELIAWQLNR